MPLGLHQSVDARVPAHRGGVRHRGLPGARRGRRVVWAAGIHDGRAAGRQRSREPRPRSQRDSQLRLRVPAAPRHREPCAGRSCARPARRSICRSRSASLPRPGVVDAPRRRTTSLLLGELSLDGGIHAARGVLPIAAAAQARALRRTAAAAAESRPRPRSWPDSTLYPVRSLTEAVARVERSGCVPCLARGGARVSQPAPAAGRRRRFRRRARAGARAPRARDRRRRRTQPAAWSVRPAPARR